MSNIRIAGYCRISVDDANPDEKNSSVENQKIIITHYVNEHFPFAILDFYEDRDKSGYTFEQRESYQIMRQKLIRNEYDMVIIKDFSRFSRRNSYGLVELETLRDNGVRIISIGDNVDYPKNSDWLNIQFRFLTNELPVIEASKKIKSIIDIRQKKGMWVHNPPYGYRCENKSITIDQTESDVIRLVFDLYNNTGWGTVKIAKYLNDQKYSSPNTKNCNRKNYIKLWNPATISAMIKNDYYIGTLRQKKYKATRIKGPQIRTSKDEQIVFENHHDAIIDKDIFDLAQKNILERSFNFTKIYGKNRYSGYLYCDDCGYLLNHSCASKQSTYICNSYTRHGRDVCESHRIETRLVDHFIAIYFDLLDSALSKETCYIAEEELIREIQQNTNELEKMKSKLSECLRLQIKHNLNEPEKNIIIKESFSKMKKELISEINKLKIADEKLSEDYNKSVNFKKSIEYSLREISEIKKSSLFTKHDLKKFIEKIYVCKNKIIRIELNSYYNELLSNKEQVNKSFKKVQEKYYGLGPIVTTENITCPYCKSVKICKHGFANGNQKHLCLACRRSFNNPNISQYWIDIILQRQPRVARNSVARNSTQQDN